MPKASTWHAAPIVAVKFPRRFPGSPSVFVHNWRSEGVQRNHACAVADLNLEPDADTDRMP